jgi:hypothetical protein
MFGKPKKRSPKVGGKDRGKEGGKIVGKMKGNKHKFDINLNTSGSGGENNGNKGIKK